AGDSEILVAILIALLANFVVNRDEGTKPVSSRDIFHQLFPDLYHTFSLPCLALPCLALPKLCV
ncbi:MAG: hypothetical protein ACK44C_02270, partial [Polaromonas sp.]